jgi:hypothetical protein
MYGQKWAITCAPKPEENMNALPILDTWQKKKIFAG